MADMQGAGAAFQATNAVGGGYIQAAALRNQADYTTKLAELDNKTLDYQSGAASAAAEDAVKRGNTAANKLDTTSRLQIGAERAAASAEGATGSAAEQNAVGTTESMTAATQAAIKTNAFREAFGLQSQAIALKGQEDVNTFQARTKANSLNYMARSSMITGWTKGIGYGFQAAGEAKKGASPDLADGGAE